MADRSANTSFGDRIGELLRNAVTRTVCVWRELVIEQRVAAIAAITLFASLFLPWFQQTSPKASASINGFAAFTFIEGSVLLVAVGILVLLFARGEKRPFHLPGGDGAVIAVGGAWVFILLSTRIFNKPEQSGVTTGIDWGLGLAFVASIALIFAGIRMRTVHRPEPPNPAASPIRRPAGPDSRSPVITVPAPSATNDGSTDDPTEEQLAMPFNDPRRPGKKRRRPGR